MVTFYIKKISLNKKKNDVYHRINKTQKSNLHLQTEKCIGHKKNVLCLKNTHIYLFKYIYIYR